MTSTNGHPATRRTRQLRVRADGPTARSATVELDGVPIGGMLTGLAIHLDVEHVQVAVLHIHPRLLDIEAAVRVELSEETAQLLEQLGWTRPTDAR